MSNPKVSLVIPVYNCLEAYLRQCLESVVGQTLQELEIILVDDCSTDGSLAVLEEYAKKDPRIVLLKHETNQGISITRNHGAEAVTGEYLYFIDCDDWLELDTLESAYEKAKERDVDVLLFQGESWFETKELERKLKDSFVYQLKFPVEESLILSGQEMFETLMKITRYSSMIWLQLVRSSYYKKEGLSFHPDTGCTGEDLAYSFYVFMSAKTMSVSHHTGYHYRVRQGSGSNKDRNYHFVRGFLKVCLLILERMAKVPVTEESKPLYDGYYLIIVHFLARNYRAITEKDPSKVTEALLNLKHIYDNTDFVTEDSYLDFELRLQREPEFCFFGAGLRGEKALDFFRQNNWKLPLAICDNSPKLQGTSLDGIPIISWQEALTRYPKLSILITNSHYYKEIYQQVEEKIGKDSILSLNF